MRKRARPEGMSLVEWDALRPKNFGPKKTPPRPVIAAPTPLPQRPGKGFYRLGPGEKQPRGKGASIGRGTLVPSGYSDDEYRLVLKRRAIETHARKRGYVVEEVARAEYAQNRCCGICKTPFKDLPERAYSIDHHHKEKRLRGILCHRCNVLVGYVESNFHLLEHAIDWVAKK